MTLTDFYLVCFLVGFLLSVITLVMGHLDLNLHFPHGGVHGVSVHWGDGGGAGHGHGGHGHGEAQLSPFNFGTIAAFLVWFGGSGYLMMRFSPFWYVFGVAIAIVCGFIGATLVFSFVRKLVRRDENLDPADYEMVGVLGKVVSSIREGGTGEIVYAQAGVRHTAGARSEDGSAIARETEVVVTRYERGICYVRRWEELANELTASAGDGSGSKEV